MNHSSADLPDLAVAQQPSGIFAQGLHVELKPLGVFVTMVPAGPTETPVLPKLGFAPESMPVKPMNLIIRMT
jgi:hypothetical protein